jgi:dTDP-4-amino-4,6-dideoxygalactose transaminase
VNIIPPLDLARQYPLIADQVGTAVLEVLASGRYIGGSLVETFEQQFANYIQVSQCVACNSGTDALYLALRALEIGAGDQVITTPFTFIATAEVINAVGATPVFVDIDPQTFNLDVNLVAAQITPKTRAIIPVHLFGQSVDMTRLIAIAKTYHLAVIEDCAQATGAEWAGRKVGSIGHVGCFSFYPTKNLGACGDGGAVTTNDVQIAAKIRSLREHGQSQDRYYHTQLGVNSRLDSLQAAILSIKLQHLDTWNQQRQTIATRYQELLHPLPGIVLPQELTDCRSVWNQYTLQLLAPEGATSDTGGRGQYRDRVRQMLQQRGISSMVYYPLPLHQQPVYQALGYGVGQFPVAEQVANQVLSLPMFPELTLPEQEQITYGLKESLADLQSSQ